MAKRFQLIENPTSYVSSVDKTKVSPLSLVSPSQNVLISAAYLQGKFFSKIKIREGYSILGTASTATTAIESAITWYDSSGNERDLRGYDDELEVYVGTINSVVFNSWEKVADAWAAVDFSFASWWSSTEAIDELLFVNGDDVINEWSGGITTFASATTNTITKQGSNTWAQDRFLITGTTKIRVKDDGGTWREFTYTGGETTDTLTGVTPDPTTFTISAGVLVIQSVRQNTSKPAADFNSDAIKVLNNQLYCLSNTRRTIYVSKNTDFTLFTYSTPRVEGEGALLTLDDVGRAFAVQNDKMLISSGRNDWYKVEYKLLEVNAALTEAIQVKKLKTGLNQGAQSQDFVLELGDSIVYLSYENKLRLLGSTENLEEPQLFNLSDPIQPDFDAATFTGGHIFWHNNRILISAPGTDQVFINELVETPSGEKIRFWQPPQILPIRKFSIISSNLHGHSNGAPETYRLFYGTNDNAKSFKATAAFAYRNYDRDDALKVFDEWQTEGFISANTKIILTLNYDYEGYSQILESEIDGNDDDLLFQPFDSGSLGDNPLGDSPMGDQPSAVSGVLSKFKKIDEFVPQDFFEIQAVYETNGIDLRWELLSHGGNIRLSNNQPTHLKK